MIYIDSTVQTNCTHRNVLIYANRSCRRRYGCKRCWGGIRLKRGDRVLIGSVNGDIPAALKEDH